MTDPRMGLRDVASFCENFDGKLTGATLVTQKLMNYRTHANEPYFEDLVRSLVNKFVLRQT